MVLQLFKKTSTLSITAILLCATMHNAQAGGVRVSAINSGGRSVLLPFSVTCIYNDGGESNSVKYSVWTGRSTVVSGCDKFALYYTSSGGAEYDYSMYAGRSYYFEWNGNHWAFYEN